MQLNLENLVSIFELVAFLRQMLYQSNTKRERQLVPNGESSYKTAGARNATSQFYHGVFDVFVQIGDI